MAVSSRGSIFSGFFRAVAVFSLPTESWTLLIICGYGYVRDERTFFLFLQETACFRVFARKSTFTKPKESRGPARPCTRLSVVNEDQPLNEPLLPTHHGGGGYVSMAKKKPSGGSAGRGTSSNSRSGERIAGRRGGGGGEGGGDGGQAAGNAGGGNDSFAYQIVRSQRERTETTI